MVAGETKEKKGRREAAAAPVLNCWNAGLWRRNSYERTFQFCIV